MTARQPRLPGLPADPRSALHQSERSRLGAEAERHLEKLNETMHAVGLATVYRVASNVKITRNLGGGLVEGRLAGKSVPDLMGYMNADGRAVVGEIKHVDVDRLKDGSEAAWNLPLSRLEVHQRAALERCHRAGGVALVIVVHGGRIYPVPWPTVERALLANQASLLASDIEPHLCPPGRLYLAPWARPASPSRSS